MLRIDGPLPLVRYVYWSVNTLAALASAETRCV